jgi:hypothetical protein
MTAVQTTALTLLTLALIGAAIAVVDAWFGESVDRAADELNRGER